MAVDLGMPGMVKRPKTLSPSAVSTWEQCPRSFWFKYILRMPSGSSQQSVAGDLFHTTMERLFKLPAEERTEAKAKELLHAVRAQALWDHPDMATMIVESGITYKEWANTLDEKLRTYFTVEDPTKVRCKVETERRLFKSLRKGFGLVGVIDRTDTAVTGEVRAIDWKTGRIPGSWAEDKNLSQSRKETYFKRDAEKLYFQLRFYALLIWLTDKVIPARMEGIYVSGAGRRIAAPEVTERDLIKFRTGLEKTFRDIQTAYDTNTFPEKTSPLCGWCAFKPICPAFKDECVDQKPAS